MANIGKVVVRPVTRTTISSPNFTPRLNVAITDIAGANVVIRNQGDTLVYNSVTDEYESKPLDAASLNITTINGGSF